MATVSPAHHLAECPVHPRRPEDARVLSLGQERLWYLDQLAPGSPAYNVPYTSRLYGNLDVDAFQKALNAIVERHEGLRTAILPIRGAPRALLLKKWALDFEVADLRAVPSCERERHAQDYLFRQAERPFDFARDVMLRCALVRLAGDEFIFLHTAPHLAFERSSVAVLYRELASLYAAAVENRQPTLPPLKVQYADFALWQRQRLSGAHLKELTDFWRQELSGTRPLTLKTDFIRPEIQSMRGRRHFFSLPLDLLRPAHALFSECGVSRYCGLLSVFYVFLHACSGEQDLCVGSPFRPRCTGIEDLIGFFVNTVALRASISPDATFRDLLAAVNRIVKHAIAHSDLTFDKVVDAVRPSRDPSRTPLFQANFRAPKEPYPQLQLPALSTRRAQYVDNGTSKFDLAFEIDASSGEDCFVEYSTDLFTEPTVKQLVSEFTRLLSTLVQTPDTPLGRIPALFF